jgi:hypothetical protein
MAGPAVKLLEDTMLEHLFEIPATERRLAGAGVPRRGGRIAGRSERRGGQADPLLEMAQAHRADAALLKLAVCAAGATLVLALAASLAG